MARAEISTEDPRADDVRELLALHLAYARATTAPEEVAALKRLDGRHAEIKSMHTAQAARRQGVGRSLLDHLVGVARERGYRRVSLETGAGPAFAAARALYASMGFTPCGPFSEYAPSPNSA